MPFVDFFEEEEEAAAAAAFIKNRTHTRGAIRNERSGGASGSVRTRISHYRNLNRHCILPAACRVSACRSPLIAPVLLYQSDRAFRNQRRVHVLAGAKPSTRSLR